MPADSDALRKFEADVFQRLEACGVTRANVELAYYDDLQDYEISIKESALTRDQIESIAEAVDGLGVLQFGQIAHAQLYADIIRQRTRAWLMQQSAAAPGLPVFDRASVSLSDFLREIEAYCGVEPGSMLESVGNNSVRFRPSALTLNPADIAARGRVLSATTLALIAHEDISFGVVGGT